MKKIFLIIVLFISVAVSAGAQMSEYGSHYEFKLGEYTFQGPRLSIYTGQGYDGGDFILSIPNGDQEEGKVLIRFVNDHKEEIESKYGVIIDRVSPLMWNPGGVKGPSWQVIPTTKTQYNYGMVFMRVYDRSSYEQWQDRQAERLKTAETEKNKRLESLDKIVEI